MDRRTEAARIRHVDLDKLIAFRIQGVPPEFIGKVAEPGYAHAAPDELIAMRIHNVRRNTSAT